MSKNLSTFTLNFVPQVTQTQKSSLEFLEAEHPEILKKIDAAYTGYHILLTLPTNLRFKDTEYYPYNLPFYEGLDELDMSLFLAISGQYKSAMQHLRFVLELAYLGIYFCKPVEEREIRDWLLGNNRTPSIHKILTELEKQPDISAVNSYLKIDLRQQCYSIYDILSGYIHTKGYASMDDYMRGSTLPLLNVDALFGWAEIFHSVIRVIALGMVGRFPQALQSVPVFSKMGFFNAPRGGLLEAFEVQELEKIFDETTLTKLRLLSNKEHTKIIRIRNDKINDIPDLTLEQLKTSFAQWWNIKVESSKGPDIPGKTWYVGLTNPVTDDGTPSQTLESAQSTLEYLLGATNIRRQVDIGDELMLAQAYTENLLIERDFFKAVEGKLSSHTSKVIHEIFEWSKEVADRIWWSKQPQSEASFGFQLATTRMYFSVFMVFSTGHMLLNYDHFIQVLGGNKLANFHNQVRRVSGFEDLPEIPKRSHLIPMNIFNNNPKAVVEFKHVVERLVENVRLNNAQEISDR